jgi:predicted PurR-regulated permease PerM
VATTTGPGTPAGPRRLTLDRAAGFTWRSLVVLAGVAVLVWLLLRLRIVLLPLLLALMISTVLVPVVARLRAHRVSRGLAALAAVLLGFLVIGGVLAIVIPAFVSQADELADQITAAVDDIEAWAREGPLGLTAAQVDELRGGADDVSGSNLLKSGVSSGVPIAVQLFTQTLLTIFFTFFVLKDGDRMWAWVLQRAGGSRRATVDAMGQEAMEALAGYVRGTAFVALVDAVFIGIGFALLGVPLVLPIALLTFFAAFIPIVGAVASGLVGVLIALADGGVAKAAVALGIVLLVQQLEGNVVQPLAVGRSVRLHPIVTIASVAVGGTLGGIVGAFVAVPIVAVVYRALEQLRRVNVEAQQEALLVPDGNPAHPPGAAVAVPQAEVVARAR